MGREIRERKIRGEGEKENVGENKKERETREVRWVNNGEERKRKRKRKVGERE